MALSWLCKSTTRLGAVNHIRRLSNIVEGKQIRKEEYFILVFVINIHGKPLMPCKPSKARKLLKNNNAKIFCYNPFTIQLIYGSSGYNQDVGVGVDLGAKYVGIAIQSQNTVIAKTEIELRGDVKHNLETRKILRKNRRSRKTRYREKRFLNRKRSEGWLPPSIQSRINNTFFWIDKFCSLIQNPKLTIEVGKFDVQKIINPDIKGVEYQQGDTYGFYDVRYFVFERDNYTCQVCKKSKNKILRTHHIIYKSKGGSNKPSNLITVCTDCHTSKNHKECEVLWNMMENEKKVPQYKQAPFMNDLRLRIFKKYPMQK
jgi:5-methylcytosine-specific restriction endonuclease McrA